MNTPISWIRAYVPDLDCTIQEYVDKMTLSGSNVECYEELDKNLEKIVVGKILSIEKHPDADKLIICQVDVGTENVQIVTGAKNVSEGDLVPVVLAGGKVAGGHDGSPNPEEGIKIKKGKLRGVPSFGMMCSVEELGTSRDMYPEAPEEGIYIFQKDVKPGDDAVEAMGLREDVLNSTELAKSTFKDVSDDEDRDFLQLFTLVCLLSFDVYMKKNIIESLIDDYTSRTSQAGRAKTKEEIKEEKREAKEEAKEAKRALKQKK